MLNEQPELVDPLLNSAPAVDEKDEAPTEAEAPKKKRGRPKKMLEVVKVEPETEDGNDDPNDEIDDGPPPVEALSMKPMRKFDVTMVAHAPTFKRTVQAIDRKTAVLAYKKEMGILSTEHKFQVIAA